jgi:hypothetical protein
MLMRDQTVLRCMARRAPAMAKLAERGDDTAAYLKSEHTRLTAELSAVELLLSLDRQRYALEAALKAGKRERVTA